jgi:hypothetical protein
MGKTTGWAISRPLIADCSEKSCGDKALIHVASPERGLYQVLAFGLSRGAQESGIGE